MYISGAGGDICCVWGGAYECGNLMVLTCMRASHYLCFFLGASSLLECVLYVSLLLHVGVWHSGPSAVLVAFPFFPANQVIFIVCQFTMCVVSPLVIVALVTVAPGMYHYYVCFCAVLLSSAVIVNYRFVRPFTVYYYH